MKIFISPEWINPIAKSHCLFKTANNATVSATKEEALNLTAVKMELESLRIPKKNYNTVKAEIAKSSTWRNSKQKS